jgi:hypothetical protein
LCAYHTELAKANADEIIDLGTGATYKAPTTVPLLQTFETGATRNLDDNKFDYEAFLSPAVLHAYAKYMHAHRFQKDGSVRTGDNWQKGIPPEKYIKSLIRHTVDLWRMERGDPAFNPDTQEPFTKEELCCAIVFNVMGFLHTLLQQPSYDAPTRRCEAMSFAQHFKCMRPLNHAGFHETYNTFAPVNHQLIATW